MNDWDRVKSWWQSLRGSPAVTEAVTLAPVKLRPAVAPDSAHLWVRLRAPMDARMFPDGAAPAVLPKDGDVVLMERGIAQVYLKADLFILPLWEVEP